MNHTDTMNELIALVRSYLARYDLKISDETVEEYIANAVASQLERDHRTGAFNDWESEEGQAELTGGAR